MAKFKKNKDEEVKEAVDIILSKEAEVTEDIKNEKVVEIIEVKEEIKPTTLEDFLF